MGPVESVLGEQEHRAAELIDPLELQAVRRSRRVPSETAPNAWARRLAERRSAGEALIDLTESNPTQVGLSRIDEAIAQALARAASAPYAPEPLGLRSAREAVAHLARETQGASVDPDDLALVASTSEAYAHLFRMLADPGDVILAPTPSYPLFEPIARLEGLRVEPYRLAFDGAWHLDRDSLARAIAKGEGRARALIVVQPNHPTGSCLSAGEIATIESTCENESLALISDEVFAEFPRNHSAERLPSLLGERRVLTFVLGGLSKCCGLPQLKLSWIHIGGPATERVCARRGLEWIADLFLSVGTPVQHALPTVLAARHSFQRATCERIARNLGQLAERITRHPEIGLLPADGGWTAVLRMPSRRSDEAWALALLERGVVVHPGHFYDFDDEHHLVVSLIVPEQSFTRGLTGLSEVLSE
jgi:aspartate/methionine/tyrosine aminotransferase